MLNIIDCYESKPSSATAHEAQGLLCPSQYRPWVLRLPVVVTNTSTLGHMPYYLIDVRHVTKVSLIEHLLLCWSQHSNSSISEPLVTCRTSMR
ncbi:hypothetical protein TNCV_3516891 [Trichonephila clavipes]|nr:hypothetical protein TNCV_3516891 [Trichonephila clavipes]